MSDLRLPVRRLSVILVLADGHRQEAALFLADGQDAADLLANPAPFVPAHAAGRIRLYARAALACIAVPPDARAADEDALPWVRRRVVVRLQSGVVMTGEIHLAAPPERRRTADFLNEEGPSFALHTDEVVYHVAKRHVAYVEEA